MAEYLQNKETYKDKPELNVDAEHLPNIEQLNKDALEKASETATVEKLKDDVHEQAKSSNETTIEDRPESTEQEFGSFTALKGETYSRTLKRVQQRLSKPERTMSKVMHNKTVEKVSDGIGKTAARPSGILGGGIVSLLGSFVLLYMSKNYGFKYNFFVFFILLVVGFMIGVLLELAIFAVKKAKR